MNTYVHRARRLNTGFPLTSIWLGFKRFFEVINNALAARNAYDEISMMSDSTLAKHGLNREELPKHIAQKYFHN